MKKIISLVVFMLCTFIAVHAEVYEGKCGSNLTWSLDTETGLLAISGTGSMSFSNTTPPWNNYRSYITNVSIPEGVTTISSYAFNGTNITAIEFPNSVTTIWDNVLYNCKSLRKVTFGENIGYVSSEMMYGCTAVDTVVWNVKKFTISSSSFTPFYDNSYKINLRSQIKSFTFGPNVETIPAYLCYGMNNLLTITIPSSVTSIGTQAFYNCTSLSTVINRSALDIVKGATTHGYVGYYASGVYSGSDMIDDFVFGQSDGEYYLVAYLGHDCQITLPANFQGKSYGIGSGVFRGNTTVNSITIPDAVTSIGDYAFYGCSNLNVVYIGNSVVSIGQSAFFECPALYKVIMLPNSVPTGINTAFQSLSGRITYVGNTNYQRTYDPFDVLGTQRVYSNLNSYFTVDGIVYALVNPSQRICDIIDCDYSGATTEFSVGNSVIYRKVTLSVDSINTNAFRNNKKMTKLVINHNHALPASLAPDCSNLRYVEINNLSGIGEEAFRDCQSIDTLIITSKGEIAKDAFARCSNKANAYYAINNTGKITERAFNCCYKLHTLIIGDSVKNIEKNAFFQCMGIVNADISNNGDIAPSSFIYSSTGEAANYHIHNKGSIGEHAFEKCSSISRLVVDTCVSTIGDSAFFNCTGLEDVTLKNNGMIGKSAFRGSSTKNPATYRISNVGVISESAFADCTFMQNLTIDTCVTTISQYAFQNCSRLEDVTLQNNGPIEVKAFEDSSTKNPATYRIRNAGAIRLNAFLNCSSMQTLTIDTCVTNIDQYAFRYCTGLEDVTINNNGTIGEKAFEGSSQGNPATYRINNTGYIFKSAFANCTSMNKLIIDTCVWAIRRGAFQKCTGLEDVTIKNNGDIGEIAFEGSSTQNPATYRISNIGQIRDTAFANCTAMTKLVIDSSVTTIRQSAFQNCTALEDVTINNNGTIEKNAFEGSSQGNPATYRINNAGVIGISAFANCSSLLKLRLGNKVTEIGARAFENCVLLDSLTLPDSVTKIGYVSFSNCQNLAFVKFCDKLSSIGEAAFADCKSIPNLFIPKSVYSIGNGAFEQCTAITLVSFEDGENTLSLGTNYAASVMFKDSPLDSVYIGRKLTYPSGYSPFQRNLTLRSIVITDIPTKIEDNEFYGCTHLYSVYIGNGVQSIGRYAFSGCSSIDFFSFGKAVQTIGEEAFSDCVAMTRLYSYCQEPPTCGTSALADIDKWSCTLYIPKGTTDAYAAADQWKDFFFVEENEGSGEITPEYTISVDFDASMGSVTGAGVYKKGAEAILVATPVEGCTFVKWEDGSVNPERHIIVEMSATYTATFSAPNYDLYKGSDAVISGVSAPNSIVLDRSSYPNAIAYSYITTPNFHLQDNVCGLNADGEWYADHIVLTDAQPFYAPSAVEAKQLSYVRTFTGSDWQALYVPFDMNYADFSGSAQIAYLNNVHQYDDDNNGSIDRTVIECISLVNENVKANWPYIIKPNATGQTAFHMENTTLQTPEENEVECQSVFTRFTIKGTYQNTSVADKYVVENGDFTPSTQDVTPFRLYLIVSNKYSTYPQSAPMRVMLVVDGKEEPTPTAVEVLYEDELTGKVYDVLGRPVSRPSHGIFVRDGEKFLVR